MQDIVLNEPRVAGLKQDHSIRFLTALAGFVANVFFCIITFTSGDKNTVAAIFLAASFLIGSFVFSRMMQVREVKPTLFMTLLYWNYALILPAIYQSRTDTYFWKSNVISSRTIELASIVLFTGTVCMLLATTLRIRSTLRTANVPITSRHDKVAFIISLFMLLYAIAMIFAFGWQSYFLPRELAGKAFSARSGGSSIMIAVGITGPKAAAISILAISLYTISIHRRSALNIATLSLSIMSNVIMNFPLASPRYFLVSIAFVTLGTIGLKFFKRRKNHIYILSPLLIYFAFPFLGQWNRGDGLKDGFSAMSISDYLSHGDMDGFQSTINAIAYVDSNGMSLGMQILSSTLFFIPRSFWESKSENSGSLAAEFAGYHFLNISMPLPGEFFMDFGFIGVIIGMTLFGFAARKGDALFNKISSNTYPGRIYSIVIASFIPIIVRGPFLSTVQAACVGLLVIWTWRIIARIRIG